MPDASTHSAARAALFVCTGRHEIAELLLNLATEMLNALADRMNCRSGFAL
jgi:hypothetical protein